MFVLSVSCDKDELTYGTITDIEGNIYNTITIGRQIWMSQNLRTTKLNDGTLIPQVTDGREWAALSAPGYCWNYNDTIRNKGIYGALYNWNTVKTGKLCPEGWHVFTLAEWEELLTYLGDYRFAGGKLKEPGTVHWLSPNTGATNESGFTALPGGGRGNDGVFYPVGEGAAWWSSTESDSSFSNMTSVVYQKSEIFIYYSYPKNFGFSVRCIED